MHLKALVVCCNDYPIGVCEDETAINALLESEANLQVSQGYLLQGKIRETGMVLVNNKCLQPNRYYHVHKVPYWRSVK
jgi:hypothetical protein